MNLPQSTEDTATCEETLLLHKHSKTIWKPAESWSFWEVNLLFIVVCWGGLCTWAGLSFALQVSHAGSLHCCSASSPAGGKYKKIKIKNSPALHL